MKYIKNRRTYVLLYGAVKLYLSTLPGIEQRNPNCPLCYFTLLVIVGFRGNENELFISRDFELSLETENYEHEHSF